MLAHGIRQHSGTLSSLQRRLCGLQGPVAREGLEREPVSRFGRQRSAVSRSMKWWALADGFLLQIIKCSELPWREFNSALRGLTNRALRDHGRVHAKRLERLAAEQRVINGMYRRVSARQFQAALRAVRALGYPTVDRRVLMACVCAQWTHATQAPPEHARALLSEARARVIRLPVRSVLRHNLLETLALNEKLVTKARRAKAGVRASASQRTRRR